MKQRRGRVFKRCSKCRARVPERACLKCSSKAWSWAFVVDIAPPGGTRKQVMRSQANWSKADAVEALTELQSSVSDGTRVEPSKMTVASYLEEKWLQAIAHTVKPTTLRGHRQAVAQVVRHVGDEWLQAFDGGTINKMYAELLEAGRADGTGGLSPGSVRRTHAVLHRAMADAVRWRLIPRNPVDDSDPPKPAGAGAAMQTWTAGQLRRFLAHAASERPSRSRTDEHGDPVALPADRLHPIYLVLATTGMRRGEVCGLRWDDVDLDARRISIRQARLVVDHEIHVDTPKSKRGVRNVALDVETVTVLRRWRTAQLEERMRWGEAWTDTGLVFTREDGTGIHPDHVSKRFKARVAEAGVPEIRLHDLRHTWASLALAAGVHPKVVSERLGHATVSMTLDVYSHAIPALQADAADTVAGLIFDDDDEDRDAM